MKSHCRHNIYFFMQTSNNGHQKHNTSSFRSAQHIQTWHSKNTTIAFKQVDKTSTNCGLVTSYGNRCGSTLHWVMACCLIAPCHYLHQCWLLISDVMWQSPVDSFMVNGWDVYASCEFEKCWFKIYRNLPGLTHWCQENLCMYRDIIMIFRKKNFFPAIPLWIAI